MSPPLIQRFTKTLLVAPHLHLLVLDSVFVDDGEGALHIIDRPAPTEEDLLQILQEVWETMTQYLKKEGYLTDEDNLDEELTVIDRWFLKSLEEPSGLMPTRFSIPGAGVEVRGSSIHAGVTVARGDRTGREQLCRYVARPPFAEDQLRLRPDGHIDLTLRSPAKNGQRVITLKPLQFMRRLIQASWRRPPSAVTKWSQDPRPRSSSSSPSKTCDPSGTGSVLARLSFSRTWIRRSKIDPPAALKLPHLAASDCPGKPRAVRP